MPPKFYHDDPEWADVEPLPQQDTGHPLASIAYTEEYSESMSYLRAIMANNEYSQRGLALTNHIISMNPAHYTVWLFRSKTLTELKIDPREELEWLNPTALKHLKNYQIWHHRQTIVDQVGSPEGETDFIATMLDQDSKNYHVWSYRQWLVKRYNMFDEAELKWTESMIGDDVRNNSAWNHRWFLVFGANNGSEVSKEIVERELEYAKEAIRKAPQNQSPWNYIRGVVRHNKLPVSTLKEFVHEFADLDKPDDVYSSHALDTLADIYGEEKNNQENAKKVLDLLATRYDPIRAQYWNYRKKQLEQTSVAA